MDFEHDLRRALKRQPAPSGFAQRVVARIQNDQVSRTASANPRFRVGQWLAAAAAAALVAFGATEYYSHRRTVAQAERTQRDIMLALQITADKFALVKQRLDEHERERVEELK